MKIVLVISLSLLLAGCGTMCTLAEFAGVWESAKKAEAEKLP